MYVPQAAIFDFDGTLADSMWVWDQVDRDFMASRGIEYRREYAETIAALGFEGSAAFFIEHFALDDSPEDLIALWISMAQDKYAHDIRLKDGAKEYLEALAVRGVPLAIATTLQRVMLIPALENNGILPLFNSILICEEHVDGGKSTPRIYELAAASLGMDLSRCTVFEDVAQAARSARMGGASVVGVYDGNAQQDVEGLKEACDLFVEGYAELLGEGC